jgi:hypothetical protein
MSKSQMKTMLLTLFDIKGTVCFHFIPQGQIVNRAYYVEILKWLCETLHRKRPELQSINWIFHHDNAPTYKALSMKQFLA